MSDPIISIRGLSFRYAAGGFALRVPNLDVAGGEKVAVVGPSGAGKTTLLNLIAGILRPATGSLRVLDLDVSAASDRAVRELRMSRIGLVFQELELLEYLTVKDNILLPFFLGNKLRYSPQSLKDAEQLAAAAGLADKLGRRPRALSQGERQRVAVCRGLIARPELLLADEPTGNLDAATTRQVVDLLLGEVAARGTTLVMVTHNRDLLDRFDRVIDVRGFLEEKAA